jgi:hypothetical protein
MLLVNRSLGIMLFIVALCMASTAQDAGTPSTVQPNSNAVATSPQWFDAYCQSLKAANGSSASLTEVCQFALSTGRQFPNFICDQTTERYQPFTNAYLHSIMRLSSVITSTVTYLGGQESYSNVKIDGKPTSANMMDIGGMNSEGEFATVLRNLFEPGSKVQFSFVRETTLGSKHALVFDFHVARENSHWLIVAGKQVATPAYHGRLWVSKSPSHIMRIEQEAEFERTFPYVSHTLTIDYADVKLGDRGLFTLPKRSNVFACLRRSSEKCLRNEIRFEHCRKFTVKSRMLPTK